MKLRVSVLLFTASYLVSASNAQLGNTCDCWIQPDASYTLINNATEWNAGGFQSTDDGSFGPIALPFMFDLYGTAYSQAWININGNVSFDAPLPVFSASGFPSGQAPPAIPEDVLVAPFWGDVDLGGIGAGLNQVFYKVTPTALFVNWVNVGYFPAQTNLLNTFQLIITDGINPIVPNGANVSFCYQDMAWTTGDANGGNGGFGGTAANVGANKGDGINFLQFGRFDQPGNTYDGPFGANDGVDWLDNIHLTFATDSASANVPPIVASQSICDTLFSVCVGSVVDLDVSFIAPEPGQITVANSTAPTLSNYSTLTNTVGLVADISTQFVATAVDTGFHLITFTGTDNGSPILTTNVTMIVQVVPGASSDTASLDICSTDLPVNLFSLLNGINPGGGWVDSTGNPFSGTFDPSMDSSGVFFYADTTQLNCPSTGTVTVNLAQQFGAGISAAVNYCSSDSAVSLFSLLGGTPSVGGSWTDPNGDPTSGTFDPQVDPPGDYCYTVLGIAPCSNDTSCVSVSVSQLPDAGLDAVLVICEDEAPTDLFSLLGGTPLLTGSWNAPNNAGHSGLLDPAVDVSGTYTYVVPGAVPCPSDTARVVVTIDSLPFAGVDNMLALCANDSQVDLMPMLGGADPGGMWSVNGVGHSGIVVPSIDTSGVYEYAVSGSGACQAVVDVAMINVTVSPLPLVEFDVDSMASCVPFPVTFNNMTDSASLNGSCMWNFGDGGSSSDCFPNYTYTNVGVYDVSLTVTNAAGCIGSTVQTGLINVDERPVADFLLAPNPVNVNNTTFVSATAVSPIATAWSWDLDGQETIVGSAAIQYTFPDGQGGSYEICLTVEDQYGCSAFSCDELVVVDPLIFVPNAFTADGDGINDGFLPVIVDADPAVHELYIFDRWGGLVFESFDPATPWFGARDNSGELLPEGVYVWRLITKGIGDVERKEYLGHVTLLR